MVGKSIMIIAVDFDGTLCTNNYPEIGEPIWKVINYCRRLKNAGNQIILWTCRSGKYLTQAIYACKNWGLEFDYINENSKENLEKYHYIDSRKICADLYIDDKNINPKDIMEVTNGLERIN